MTPRRCALPLALVLGGLGCSDISVPDGLLITCKDDADCPDALVCDPALERCVAKVDESGIALEAVTVPRQLFGLPNVAAGDVLELRFTLSAEPSQPPVVRLFGGAGDVRTAEATQESAREFVGVITPDGTEPDGFMLLVIDAVDQRGITHSLQTELPVVFDFTPPQPFAVALQRVPDPLRTPVATLILGDTVVGPAIDVRVTFSVNEAVFVDGTDEEAENDPDHVVVAGDPRAPTLTTTGLRPVLFERDRQTTNPLIFDLVWEPTGVVPRFDGAHDVVARLTDLAGNTTEVTLPLIDTDGDDVADSGLVVDTEGPEPPDVQTTGRVVFERAPWGRLDAAQPDLYRVVAADGSSEPGAIVIVSRDLNGQAELARVTATDIGAFTAPEVALSLPTGDIETVFVRAVDRAGNTGPSAEVIDVRWWSTPLFKEAGDTFDNPHRFDEAGVFAPALAQAGWVERGADDGIGEAGDNTSLTTIGAGSWRLVSTVDGISAGAGAGEGVVDATLATDPVNGSTMLFGAISIFEGQGPAGYVGNAICGARVANMKLRGADDRWRDGGVLPADLTTFATVHAAFVPSRGRTYALAYAGLTYSFDGATWQEECGYLGCVGSSDTERFLRQPAAMAYDPNRAVLVAALAGDDIVEMDPAADDPQWAHTDVPFPFGGHLTFSERLGLVVQSDTTLWRWDGTALTELCTDVACLASKPGPRPGANIGEDRDRGTLVMFGGSGDVPCSYSQATQIAGSGGLAPQPTPAPTDTWTFDGTLWSSAPSATSPPPRTRHAMAWDPIRQRVLLVGGDECECLSGQTNVGLNGLVEGLPNDTWEWDGSDWSQVALPPPVAPGLTRSNPSPLRDHAMTEGPLQGGALLFGEGGGMRVFKDDAWFLASGAGPYGARMPAFATAPDGDVLGYGGAVFSGDALTPGSPPFHLRATGNVLDLACPANPTVVECQVPFSPRFAAAAWHDGARFWFHGGATAIDGQSQDLIGDVAVDELWTWEEGVGWALACPPGTCGPGRRALHRVVLDGNGTAVLYGGIATGNSPTDETWLFDGVSWTPLPTDQPIDRPLPPARAGHALAYDAARGAVVTAYGTNLGGIGFNPFPPIGPVLTQNAVPLDRSEVWELVDGPAGPTWTLAPHADPEGDDRPTPRSSVSAAGLPGGGVVMYGGTPSPAQTYSEVADFFAPAPRSDETWVWSGGAENRPAHRFTVAAREQLSRRAPDDEVTGLVFSWRSSASRTNAPTALLPLDLLWWDGFRWRSVPDADRVDCGVGCVGGRLNAALAARAVRAAADGSFVVAVATRDANGPAPGRVQLSTDGVEVALEWRRTIGPP